MRVLPTWEKFLNPWVGFFSFVAGAWFVLFVMTAELARHAGAAAIGPGMAWLGSMLSFVRQQSDLGTLHLHGAHDSLSLLVGMWALMSLAMMAPTIVPMLRTYLDMSRGNPERIPRNGFWALAGGYLMVWLLYSVTAALLQQQLAKFGLLTSAGVSASLWLSAALFTMAAAYQFSNLKYACLNECRSPMAFFMSQWREGARGALHMGMRHGIVCVGCCWALMALAFVGGTMNLAWMGMAMLIMIIEKLSIGRWLTTPLGIALALAALWTAGQALIAS